MYRTNVKGHEVLVDDRDKKLLQKYRWSIRKKGNTNYVYHNYKDKTLYLHHLIIGRPPKGMVTDHINYNGLDNRGKNLRFVNRTINNLNSDVIYSLTGFKGVSFHNRNAFRARCRGNYLGSFGNPVEAAFAYDDYLRKTFKEKVFYNFPYFIKRERLYKWLWERGNHIISIYYTKRSDGQFEEMVCVPRPSGAIKKMPSRLRGHGLVVVWDYLESKYKSVGLKEILAVKFRNKSFRII